MLVTSGRDRRLQPSISRIASWLEISAGLYPRTQLRSVTPNRSTRVLLSLAVIAIALAGCGAETSSTGIRHPVSVSPFDGTRVTGLSAPDFALRDQQDALVRLSAERGRYVLITFLYVHCPDVCPIIAGQLNEALRELGPARTDVRVLAVSVDPRGDTPTAVHRFIAAHDLLPEFRYLTGTLTTLEPVWRAYHVASTQTGKGLVIGHTAFELLLDRSGKPRLVYDSRVKAQQLVHDLRALGLEA